MEQHNQYLGIKLPGDVKRKIRLLAAKNETSMADISLRLIRSALDSHDSIQAQELAGFMAGGQVQG